MLKIVNRNKGIALLMVLTTLLVAAILGAILMNFMASQARLTHHQVSRIQAYYAAFAGMNYAYERLRTGTWAAGTNCTCLPPTNCCGGPPAANSCCLATLDPNFAAIFPSSVSNVEIYIVQFGTDPGAPSGLPPCQNPPSPPTGVPAGIDACIHSRAIYNYTPETPF
ncbi:MAG: hypothetical protein V2A64_02320 [Candidatus Omnitrophota bacterium]